MGVVAEHHHHEEVEEAVMYEASKTYRSRNLVEAEESGTFAFVVPDVVNSLFNVCLFFEIAARVKNITRA